jgi:saccharopepsin
MTNPKPGAQSGVLFGRTGVLFGMDKGPYQNNGASPWFAGTSLGTPPQQLKFAIDTGTNILWSTSSMCAPDSCQHYSGGRFDWGSSDSFRWLNKSYTAFSFGPWGTMQVVLGADQLGIPGQPPLPVDFYLSADYSGPQFGLIDWDGGIGIPSGSAYVQPGNSFIVEELMNNGAISTDSPYVSFDWDPVTRAGSCQMGGFDPSKIIPYEGIYMPWTPYTQFQGVEYIWSTPLDSYVVGGQSLGSNLQFALDSGSSQFKGDNDLMNQTLAIVGPDGGPPVTLGLNGGEMTVTSDMYMVKMEAGPDQGSALPQFNPLGMTNLALVGSVVMENCYTIFGYVVSYDESGNVHLAPGGMWAFNRPGGPKLITKPSANLKLPSAVAPVKY